MPKITIDNRSITVDDGATILEAARQLGIEIPTLCHYENIKPCTTCMVCVVKVEGFARLLPSCSTKAVDGMVIESESDEVYEARKLALELLLGEHLGDCEAPCESVCPASLNIPKMLRAISGGDKKAAIEAIRKSLPLAAVLGRVCPAPCEKACRRKDKDEAINIRTIHGATAEDDMKSAPYIPVVAPHTGKKVAIIGAGAAGLSTAFFLLEKGHTCHIFDSEKHAGGQLLKLPEDKLPPAVLEREASLLKLMGANFHPGVTVGKEPTLASLRK
ncbi:MAG: (2Fe-2S)-binding protein, partial [Planctomycetes bacterium]|nr:(2Fe-2S)-binding protein [Planctomycetota bacterium]